MSQALKVPIVSADLVDGYSEFQRIGAATENHLSGQSSGVEHIASFAAFGG